MFFTKAGRIVAWNGTELGFVVMLTGYEIDINGTGSVFADVFPLATPQKAEAQGDVFIHQGGVVLFCSLVLGVLTEISRPLLGRGGE